jgi:hypothetical protein
LSAHRHLGPQDAAKCTNGRSDGPHRSILRSPSKAGMGRPRKSAVSPPLQSRFTAAIDR